MSWLARASTLRLPKSSSEPSLAGFVAGKRARPAASLHCLDDGGRSLRARSSVPPTALVVSRNGRCAARVERRPARFRSTPTPPFHAGDRVAKAALRPGVRPRLDPSVLGLVLAARSTNPPLLIVAQILFAYAFDLLLTWSRRDTATLGFGPFPIVFSKNLFLWFRPDWFYLQFVMIALGFAAKELIRWNRDGRRDARLQSVCVHAHGIFSGPDFDRHERHHVG